MSGISIDARTNANAIVIILDLILAKAYAARTQIIVLTQVGYSNQYYFSSCFKKKMGVTPSAYRES